MASNEEQSQESPAEPASEPIERIIGRRIRMLRETAGLRQADIANGLAAAGFKWGRSSVAALENGTRKLSIEELVALPIALDMAGLPAADLIRDGDMVRLSDAWGMWGHTFRRMLLSNAEQGILIKGRREHERAWREALFPNTSPLADKMQAPLDTTERLFVAQFVATQYAPILLGVIIWPQLRQEGARKALKKAPSETDRKVGKKISANPKAVALMAQALWGRSLTEERDARAQERGEYSDARSLQGARGYVTRELTGELQQEWNSELPQPQHAFPTKREEFERHLEDVELGIDRTDWLEGWVTSMVKAASRAQGEPFTLIRDELGPWLKEKEWEEWEEPEERHSRA